MLIDSENTQFNTKYLSASAIMIGLSNFKYWSLYKYTIFIYIRRDDLLSLILLKNELSYES